MDQVLGKLRSKMSLLSSRKGTSEPGTREHAPPASHRPRTEGHATGAADCKEAAVRPGPAASAGQGQGDGVDADASGGWVPPAPSILSLPRPLLARALQRASRREGFDLALVCREWAALAPAWRACVRVREAAGLCPGELLLKLSSTPQLQALILLPFSGTYDLWPREKAEQNVGSGPWRQPHWRTPCEFVKQFHPAVEGMTLPALHAALEACPQLQVLRAPDLVVWREKKPLPEDPDRPYNVVPEPESVSLSAADIFARAPHLTELDLHCIQLKGLSLFRLQGFALGGSPVLSALRKLQVLRATVESPTWPGVVALRVLPQLRVLSLQLKSSPSPSAAWRVSSLPALVRLDISINTLPTIHFQDLPSLQALSLSFQRGALPHSISSLSTLSALDVDCYDHWDVEVDLSCPWLTALTSLRSLKWAMDHETPPSVVFQLTGLTSLWVHLGLQCHGTKFSRLTNLQVLRLEGSVPASVLQDTAQLTSLRELRVGRDGDCSPALLVPMPLLQHLQLSSEGSLTPEQTQELSRLDVLRSVCATSSWASMLPMRSLTRLEELYLTLKRGFHDRRSREPLPLPGDLHLLTRVRRVEICLSSNIATLQPLTALQALEELRVSTCSGIKAIPGSLGALPRLRRLQLRTLTKEEGMVPDLPPGFFSRPSFPSLTDLDLGLGLHQWPASLGELKRLKRLRVTSCDSLMWGRRVISVQVQDLRVPESVQVLELEGVRLLFGPKSTTPRDLGAREDPPRSVPASQKEWDFPGPLPLLRRLTLQDIGGLSVLPRNLGSLQGLTYLRLIDLPEVETLPASFAQLTSLQGIHVKGCPRLRRVPKAAAALPCFRLHPEFLRCLDVY